jgi:hypothetical protein
MLTHCTFSGHTHCGHSMSRLQMRVAGERQVSGIFIYVKNQTQQGFTQRIDKRMAVLWTETERTLA